MRTVGDNGWHMIDEVDLVALIADHAGLSRLCAELEAVADGLPILPPDDNLMRLRYELEHRLPTHEARETALIAALFGTAPEGKADRAILEQIRARRASCVVQGQDLVTALKGDGIAPCIETFGYMLRCFFQSCRQGMAFEELAILYLGGQRLTLAGAAVLRGSLEARCAA